MDDLSHYHGNLSFLLSSPLFLFFFFVLSLVSCLLFFFCFLNELIIVRFKCKTCRRLWFGTWLFRNTGGETSSRSGCSKFPRWSWTKKTFRNSVVSWSTTTTTTTKKYQTNTHTPTHKCTYTHIDRHLSHIDDDTHTQRDTDRQTTTTTTTITIKWYENKEENQ